MLNRSCGAVVAIAVFALSSPVSADPQVVLGPSDNFALDQPRVAVRVEDLSAGGDVPGLANTFLLDTGAQGVLAVGYAVTEMVGAGYAGVAQYNEQGVAGTSLYDLSPEYGVSFAGTDMAPYLLSDVRMMTDESGNFGGFSGIIGMPAMLGRVTALDMAAMAGGELDPVFEMSFGMMGVDFRTDLPADTGHRYTVPLTLVDFPATGAVVSGQPLPTYAPLPFANVKTAHGQNADEGSFLIDTGAQLSIISTQTAIDLGLDTNDNGQLDEAEVLTFATIGGVGDEIMVPIVAVDRLVLPTDQGVDLVWTDLHVVVVDVRPTPGDEAIAGIFGCDLLTSGWTTVVLGGGLGLGDLLTDLGLTEEQLNGLLTGTLDLGGEVDPLLLEGLGFDDLGEVLDLLQFFGSGGELADAGYFETVSFDFRGGASSPGSMVLDLNPDLDVPVPEPGTLTAMALGALALLRRRRR